MKPTLGKVLALSLLGLAAVLGLLFVFVLETSRASIIESSERLRGTASREIGRRVVRFLERAPAAVELFQTAVRQGLVDLNDSASVEKALFPPLLSDRNIGEVTLIYGTKAGVGPDGYITLTQQGRGQWSALRSVDTNGDEHFWTRHVYQEAGKFLADRRECNPTIQFSEQRIQRDSGEESDPTADPTFTTPARADLYGRLVWSDVHWPELDGDHSNAVVRVQQVISDAKGEFVGVLRVGLMTQQLDEAVRQLNIVSDFDSDPHRLFLCDAKGRLITRVRPTDRFRVYEDDEEEAVRIAPENLPPELARALADPMLRLVNSDNPVAFGQFREGNEVYLTTFRALPETQGWVVGIVVPRSFYFGKLTQIRDRLLAVSLGLMLSLLFVGGLILRAVKHAQAQIARESAKMNRFDFTPASTGAPFRDISEVLESLEQAKTAMRAMGKYVPIDLVRRLYCDKSEPVLSADPMEISIMFTDIKDFTGMSERLDADILAAALGRYLDVMTRIIQQETRGTIDKYIGDAIMTIWNAPERVPEDSRMACTAALRCRDAARALSQSPEWNGLPPFETRFGLHRGTALVGHFGAHDRMNYTAIGDAVNLASRLEGLNKEYGTAIIVSEAMVEAVRQYFDFRLLDLVAVKGKSHAVRIYELVGVKQEGTEPAATYAKYERAFTAYVERDFAAALSLLESQNEDPPSAVLAGRCRAFLEEPPPPDWRGVFTAISK